MSNKMDNLIIPSSKYTPDISMDIVGKISLVGKSYPENTFEFYAPVMSWIECFFAENTSQSLSITFDISYFNSSSSKLFFDFFDILEAHCQVFTIRVNWLYDEENESAEEAGKDFIEDFELVDIKLVKTVTPHDC